MDNYKTGLHLWDRWTEMWNGRPELALELVAPKFTLHLTSGRGTDPTTIDTPARVVEWVRGHRAKFTNLTFSTQVGPFVDEKAGVVAGPWSADTTADGKPSFACGMDTIAFRDGLITEYWTLSTPVDRVATWDQTAFQYLKRPRI
ncbi:MAG: nuclear transport factor 2 family protein [Kofleriaceae bacterium]